MSNDNEKDFIIINEGSTNTNDSNNDKTESHYENTNDDMYRVNSKYSTDRVYDRNNQFNNPYESFNNSTNPSNNDKNYNKKKKKGYGKKIALGVCGALLCTIIGGVAGAGTVLYLGNSDDSGNGLGVKKVVYEVPKFSDEKAMSTIDAINKVKSAVVTVSVKSIQQGIFGQQESTSGVGSGFIIDESGSIMTNYHVVQGASSVKVILSTGKEVNAKVVNYDANLDLAILKITDKDVKVPGVAELGDSDRLQQGEEVIAIGSPLGEQFTGTTTKGIISGLNRVVSSNNDQDIEEKYIQTDASINPGNSGGPLINSLGQVIGINTSKINDQTVEGMGFSIPINIAKEKIDSLSKPLLKIGISYKDVTEELSKQYDLPVGVWVASVDDFSPAAKAGIQTGDVIIKFDGKTIKNGSELNRLKGQHNAGDVVKVVVSREDKEYTLSLKLEESR